MNKCVCSSNPTTTGLSLDYFEKDFKINFQTIKSIKGLTLLKCNDCGTVWLLDNSSINKFCTRINSQQQIDLIKEWETIDTKATHLKSSAEKIGTSSTDYIEYPCKAKLNNGTILDFCVLTKWTHHPLISWQGIGLSKFIYSSQVKSIEPSQFSISLNHRISMRNSQIDYYRDYVPLVFVLDSNIYFRDEGCKSFYLDSNFLRYENIKGSDINEINQDIKTYANYKEKDNLKNEVTLILFDEW